MDILEFINKVLIEEGIEGDPKEILKQITEIARQRAKNNCAAISDEEVREMVIKNAELSLKIAQEKRRNEAERFQRNAEEKAAKEAEKKKKAIEKEKHVAGGEQMGLFDL